MFCANCGTKQNEGEKFCPNCGTRFEESLKIEETKDEELSKSETSKLLNTISGRKDVTVQSNKKTLKQSMKPINNELSNLLTNAENGDYKAILRLAIIYEFGLGININKEESNRYYSILKDDYVYQHSFVMLNHHYGVLENKYKVSPEIYYNIKNGVQKNISRKGNAFILDYYIPTRYSSDARYKEFKDLESKVRDYNKNYGFFYSEIIFKAEGLSYLIKGFFERKYNNDSVFKTILKKDSINKENEAEHLFMEINKLSKKLSIEL